MTRDFFFFFWDTCVDTYMFLSPAAGLLCGAGPDDPVLVGSEDTLQAGPLHSSLHLSLIHI